VTLDFVLNPSNVLKLFDKKLVVKILKIKKISNQTKYSFNKPSTLFLPEKKMKSDTPTNYAISFMADLSSNTIFTLLTSSVSDFTVKFRDVNLHIGGTAYFLAPSFAEEFLGTKSGETPIVKTTKSLMAKKEKLDFTVIRFKPIDVPLDNRMNFCFIKVKSIRGFANLNLEMRCGGFLCDRQVSSLPCLACKDVTRQNAATLFGTLFFNEDEPEMVNFAYAKLGLEVSGRAFTQLFISGELTQTNMNSVDSITLHTHFSELVRVINESNAHYVVAGWYKSGEIQNANVDSKAVGVRGVRKVHICSLEIVGDVNFPKFDITNQTAAISL
jgi:hypothetical protein